VAKVTSGGGLGRLAQSIRDLESKKVAVGFFDAAHYPDGTPVAYVATIQEFGHGAIPPRSFMRSTITEQRDAWRNTLAAGSRRVLADQMTTMQMLDDFGVIAVGNIKDKIMSIMSPGLSEATLYLRRNPINKSKPKNTSTKPLVDRGIMLGSVESKVTDK
jgi:hypothetical protein